MKVRSQVFHLTIFVYLLALIGGCNAKGKISANAGGAAEDACQDAEDVEACLEELAADPDTAADTAGDTGDDKGDSSQTKKSAEASVEAGKEVALELSGTRLKIKPDALPEKSIVKLLTKEAEELPEDLDGLGETLAVDITRDNKAVKSSELKEPLELEMKVPGFDGAKFKGVYVVYIDDDGNEATLVIDKDDINIVTDSDGKTTISFTSTVTNGSFTPVAGGVSDTTPPVAGNSGVIASANLTATGVDLSWSLASDETAAASDLTYRVYYSTNAAFDTLEEVEGGTPVGDFSANLSSKSISGLANGTTYYFNVVVKDKAGNKSVYAKVSASTPNPNQVATPSFSPAGATFTSSQNVTISTATAGATIYYTTDGSDPTAASTQYAGAVSVATSQTLKAIAVKAGLADSPIGTASYSIAAVAPTFSVAAGIYTSTQSVSLSSITAGATIYYTTDGSTPTTSSSLYSGAISVSATQTLKAIAVKAGLDDSSVASASYTITGTVATPTFSVAAGIYTSTQSVTLATATAGASIYYTTDGSAPTTSDTLYSGAISVSATQTVKAIAVLTNWDDSAVATAAYTITGTVATPTFSVAAGMYASTQSVTLSTTTAGATIYYTTDGSDPTSSDTQYAGAISVSATQTLKAIAILTNWDDSAIASAAYTITGTVATPTFSPAAGAYATSQDVTISTTTPGATIYYTTDGSAPTTSSTEYSGTVTVSADMTLKAIAVLTNWDDSAVVSGDYTMIDPGDCSASELTNAPFANWAGGTDPGGVIYICTAAQLNRIYDGVTYDGVTPAARLNRSYEMKANVVLSGPVNPIGSVSGWFRGSFNGGGYAISNVTINDPSNDYIGLFPKLGNNATISDLTLSNVSIAGDQYVGGLVGYASGSSITIENITVTGGTVAGNFDVGGLIGYTPDSTVVQVNDNAVDNLTVGISGTTDRVGGLVGSATAASIQRCSAGTNMTVQGADYVGGLVGWGALGYYGGAIRYSYAKGTVIGTGNYIGGFIGESRIPVSNSYSAVDVNTGAAASSGDYIGGFAGNHHSSYMMLNYSIGNVCDGSCTGASNAGPFSGGGTPTYSYWDNQTSNWATAGTGGGMGFATADMQQRSTFVTSYDSFDFATVWRLPSGGGYPILQWEDPPAAFSANALFAGGSGSSGSPWQISNAEQLRNVLVVRHGQASAWNGNYYFVMTASIDLSGTSLMFGGAQQFRGHFDGGGYTISNLTINEPTVDNVGLFPKVSNNTTIENLTLSNVSISGNQYVGGLVGYASGSSITIENITVTGGTVAGNFDVGGLIGYTPDSTVVQVNDNAVDNLTVGISGTTDRVGGLVGSATAASIQRCSAGTNMTVQGADYVGGLVGWGALGYYGGAIRYSYAKGTVIGTGNYIGGFIGESRIPVSNSYSAVDVNTGAAASSGDYIGGFAGNHHSSYMMLNYSIGNVCDGSCTGASNAGPFSGGGTPTYSYWDNQTSNWATAGTGGGMGFATADMQQRSTFVTSYDSFDFATVWRLPSGGGYPILQWEDPPAAFSANALFAGGSGSSGSPWQISNEEQLRNVIVVRHGQASAWNGNYYFELTASIDLAGKPLMLGGSQSFRGGFNGGGYTISNLTINEPSVDYVALFPKISTNTTIENLTLSNVSISGDQYVAGLIGYGGGSNVVIENNVIDGGSIAGTQYVGGLVGQVPPSNVLVYIRDNAVDNVTVGTAATTDYVGGLLGAGTEIYIQRCAVGSGVLVQGDSNVGGLVGYAATGYSGGGIILSYSLGAVVGTGNYIGGFIGDSRITVQNNYSMGNVNTGGDASSGDYIGGFVGSVSSGSVLRNYTISNVCDGDCTGATNAGPFSGSGSATESFWNSDTAGGWANAGTGGGTAATDAELTVDGTVSGSVDALDGTSWSTSDWEIDPSLFGSYTYPVHQWTLAL